jgi:hypothetical protein
MATADKAVKVADAATPQLDLNDRANWEWVTIPQKDLLDSTHPGVRINRESYGPGKHLVHPLIAAEIRDRLSVFDAQTIKILQPRKDLKALQDLYKSRGPESVDMTSDNTKGDRL